MAIGRIGQEFIVNTTTTGNQIVSSVTVLADGRFVVTWESGDLGDGSDTCVRARIHNGDGSPAGNDFIVNTTATNSQINPTVSSLADGRFVVTWTSLDAGDGSGSCIRPDSIMPMAAPPAATSSSIRLRRWTRSRPPLRDCRTAGSS